MELGVLRGENALQIHRALSPESLFLIDAWSSEVFIEYDRINSHRSWVTPIEQYSNYFGGSVFDQATLELLFEQTCRRFADIPNVQILRTDTRNAMKVLESQEVLPRGIDFVYVDANHQYESVFDDLMLYSKIVSRNGVIQLNDCCHSEAGVRQNLGVLEAVARFVKMSNFVPVAMTNTDFSDLILANRGSQTQQLLHKVIDRAKIIYVEVPEQLLASARVRGDRGNISFI